MQAKYNFKDGVYRIHTCYSHKRTKSYNITLLYPLPGSFLVTQAYMIYIEVDMIQSYQYQRRYIISLVKAESCSMLDNVESINHSIHDV